MILTTTGTASVVTLSGLRDTDNNDRVLNHPETIDLSEYYASDDIQAAMVGIQSAIDNGQVIATNDDGDVIDNVAEVAVDLTNLAPIAFSGSWEDLEGKPSLFEYKGKLDAGTDSLPSNAKIGDIYYISGAGDNFGNIQGDDDLSIGDAIQYLRLTNSGDGSNAQNWAPYQRNDDDAGTAAFATNVLTDIATNASNIAANTTAIGNVPGTGHSHVKADITDFSDGDYATALQGGKADSATQPGDLGAVATSNNYNDLSNKPTIPPVAPVTSVNGNVGVVVLDKADIGLGNVNNTADANKIVSTPTQTALNLKANQTSLVSTNSNVSTNTGSISTIQGQQTTQDSAIALNTAKLTATGTELVPGDNISELTNNSNFQTAAQVSATVSALVDSAPGTLDTLNELAAAIGDDPNFAATIAGSVGTVQTNLNTHSGLTNNPHAVTKAQVGLGNANNTSDVNKPVSTAQASAIGTVQTDLNNHKGNTSNPHNTIFTDTLSADADTNLTTNKSIVVKSGASTVMTISNSNDTATEPDILFGASGLIAAENNMNFMIDSEDSSTSREFSFRKNSNGNTGSVEIMSLKENGTLRLHTYSSRDDGPVPHTSKQLYLDASGNINVGQPRISTLRQSGRIYLETNNRWISGSDDNYGTAYYQLNENAATGANPLIEWEHNGDLVVAGQFLKSFHLMGRTNSTQVTDIEVSVRLVTPNPLSRYATGIDNDSEVSNIELFRGFWKDMVATHTGQTFSGNTNDKHWGIAEVNHLVAENSELRVYYRPVGSLSGRRYFNFQNLWEII